MTRLEEIGMRYVTFVLLTGLIGNLSVVTSAQAVTITYDFATAPEASDFNGLASASTTVDSVELSATLFSGTAFNTTAGALGASGVGSAVNFDGEGGFNFSFDAPGTLTSITLVNFGTSYNLVSPNNGTQNYTADFSSANYTFLANEIFTFQHLGGSYRVATIVIEVAAATVPEPNTMALAGLGILILGSAWSWKRLLRRP